MRTEIDRKPICPRCPNRLRLREEDILGGVIDKCPGCRGAWFDAGEINSVKDALLEEFRWNDIDPWKLGEETQFSPSGLDCPRCETLLSQIRYRAVEIDFCVNCEGAWFDGGEFLEVLREHARESESVPLKGLLAQLRRQLAEILTGDKGMLEEARDFLMAARMVGRKMRKERANDPV